MKRILFVISLILVTAFSSCKKDDTESSDNADLNGSWAEKPSIE